MEQRAYREAIIQFIQQHALPPDKFSHQPRLYALAVSLAGNAPFDDDVLFAACWMHDLGVFVGHRPATPEQLVTWDHVAYAMKEVPQVLQSLGLPCDKILAVIEAIRTHLPDRKPATFEGALLRDADLLEQLGTVGILRIVSKVGRDTRYPTYEAAVHVLKQNVRDLPALLTLPAARAKSTARVAAMNAFLEAHENETGA